MRKVVFVLFLMMAISAFPAVQQEDGKSLENLSYEELVAKYERITQVRKFLETETPQKYPWSMNEFFTADIYEKLVGNEFFGYYFDEGVQFSGNRIAIDMIGVIKDRGYETHRDTFCRVFLKILKVPEKYSFQVDKNARFSVGICIVSLKEKDDTESPKGLVLETYIKDRQTGKRFYHRCGTGSSGDLEQAMRVSAARIICNLFYLKQKK